MLYTGNNAINQRLELENAKRALVEAGFVPKEIIDAVLTQTTISLEQPLTATGTILQFPVLVNDQGINGVRKTERRLKLQDAVYVSAISMDIFKAASATDYANKPISYPSPVTFPTGEAAALYALYNGSLKITVNNSVLMPSYSLQNFLTVPQTQLTAATNSPGDEYDGMDRMALQPNPVLIGQKGTEIEIILPQAIGSTLTANVYVRLRFHGLLAQNVTVVS